MAYEIPDAARIVAGRVFSEHPDPAVVRFIAKYGGRNLYGDPLFRLVWGAERRHWKVAVWHDKDAHGNVVRRVRECRYHWKYPKFVQSWVLEFWKPPTEFEGGDRERWLQRRGYKDAIAGRIDQPVDVFPSRGDYEIFDFFGGDDAPPPTVMNVKHSIDRYRALREMTRAQFDSDEAARAAREDLRTTMHYYDMVRDATRPSAHEPWVSMAG